MKDPEYDGERDFALGIEEAYRLIRARIAAGGPPWVPGPPKWGPEAGKTLKTEPQAFLKPNGPSVSG